jgi:glucose/arabinose dehydrogenase
VGNTGSVVRFRYRPGQLEAEGPPERVADLPGHGYRQHWTRNVVVSPDGARVFASVGSATNDSVERDPRRAAIRVFDPDGAHARVFASGLRNAVGMAFEPRTGALWAVVNERDELGDDLPPDYLTVVRDGAFYGWPFAYAGRVEDPRHRGERPDLVARATVPDLALGAHVASLGLVFYTAAQFPGDYRGDALVSLHGSWNRAQRVGYKVVRVRFRDGRPTGEVTDFVAGWLTDDGAVWGRPVGLAQAADGAVLIADDGGSVIWRVSYVR